MFRKVRWIFLALCFPAAALAAADPVDTWTQNYNRLVALLQKTNTVSACKLSLSVDPNSPSGSYDVNFLTAPTQTVTFEVDSPAVTQGRSRVSAEKNHVLRYSVSDFAGWVNLIVQLDDTETIITGTTMTKTLPSGQIYTQGLTCGESPR